MFKHKNDVLQPNAPFTLGEGETAIQYPANWLQLSTPEEKQNVGIYEVPDLPEVQYDNKFYFVSTDANGLNTAMPRDVADVQRTLLTEVNRNAYANLNLTQWYVDRLNDPTSQKPIPQTVLDERTAIRQQADDKVAEINSKQTIPELQEIVTTFALSFSEE